MPTETHAVYAVLDTALGPHKVRVSAHTDWITAQAVFAALEEDPRPPQTRRGVAGQYASRLRRIVNPGYSCYGRPVKFFAVRASNDPAWPADRPVLRVVSTL